MNERTLYQALVEAGASEETARKAVEGLIPSDQVVTKAELNDVK